MTEARTRRLAAVWFADIVGYTALSTRNEDAALAVVDEFQRLSKESVGDKGRVVKFLGDGALAVFDSANRAIESAISLRDAFAASDVARRHGCTLSVGVHMGEVVQADDGDVYGDGVNVAARIEGVATTNQVVVSEEVYRLIRNRPGYNPQSIGEHMLKGVAHPAPLYVLARPGETVVAPQAKPAAAAVAGTTIASASSPSHRRAVAIGTFAGVAGFVLLSVFVAWSTNVVDLSSGGDAGADATSPDSAPVIEASAPPAAEAPTPARTPGPTVGGAGATDAAARSDASDPTRTRDGAAPLRPSGSDDVRTPTVDATQPTPPPADPAGDRLLVLVFGEAPAGAAEGPILRSLGNVSGVTATDAPGAALLRRNPEVARGVLQGDISALAELAGRQGIEYIVLGNFESSATQARGGMYSGSAQLGLRLYRVSTGEIIDSGAFGVGTGTGPAIAGATELGVRTQAAQEVGRAGAVAARRWLLAALRN